ncbi:hypothetical protein MTR67_048118 [Solanum verrucosum]|uniref:Uncharacterized protein n=1 Tax=Solanum verrucosum TaxID=315347 RepID=A0AAF0V0V6_SOLVR|nr:hypothetical protein MTR67_048118 [Solanum verrucosum]
MDFQFTAIYGLHNIKDRGVLWADLKGIADQMLDSWLIMGDFNTILHIEDRSNGAPVKEAEIRDFNKFLVETGMMEMKAVGRDYTWTNEHVYSRIDRAIVNAHWIQKWAHMEANIMDPRCSDHSPLCVALFTIEKKNNRPFRFLNCLATHREFFHVVQRGWNEPAYGASMNRSWMKLKYVKMA